MTATELDQPPSQALLAANLRRLRREQGLTQRALADLATLSRSAIAQIEAGRYLSASGATVDALAKALGVKPSKLFAQPASSP